MGSSYKREIVFDVTRAVRSMGWNLENQEIVKRKLLEIVKTGKYPMELRKHREDRDSTGVLKDPTCTARVVIHRQKVGGVRILYVYRFMREVA